MTHTERFSLQVIALAKGSSIAALLPFALGTLSCSEIVLASSAILSVVALVLPFWPGWLANIALSLTLWFAALLVAVSGLRARRTEQHARQLEGHLHKIEQIRMAHQRWRFLELLDRPDRSSKAAVDGP